MPLQQRVPKLKGFNNPFRVEYQAINLDMLEASPRRLDEVTPATLHAHGLVHKGALVKVLGRGELTRAGRRVKAHALLEGGRSGHHRGRRYVEILPLPWGDRRPPAKGNQLTNR